MGSATDPTKPMAATAGASPGRVSRSRPLLGLAGGVLGLWLLGLATCTAPIQDDLTERARAALSRAGLETVDVSFSGRDATLRGQVASEELERADRIVRGLEGVRRVDVDGLPLSGGDGGGDAESAGADGSGVPIEPFTAVVDAETRMIALTGTVTSDEIRAAAVQAAERSAPDGFTVVDRLVVAAVRDERVPGHDAVLLAVGELDGIEGLDGVRGLVISRTDDGSLVVEGDVASDGLRAAIITRIEAVARTTVVDRLIAATTTPTSTVAPTAAPPTTAAPEQVIEAQFGINALVAGRVIEFATGGAALTPAGAAVLDEIVPLLNRAAGAKVQIVGHTDNTGNASFNEQLSVRRAETVRGELVRRGIGVDRLSTAGFGGDRPIADNGTAEGRQRNRRIEFVLGA